MSESEPTGDDRFYGLVMPFVCVKSVGGPWDDQAFVAGAQFSDADHALRAHPARHAVYGYPALERQFDLLAMHHGYTLTAEPWDEHPDEHVLYTFVPAKEQR